MRREIEERRREEKTRGDAVYVNLIKINLLESRDIPVHVFIDGRKLTDKDTAT